MLNQLKTAVNDKVKALSAQQQSSVKKQIEDPFRSGFPITSGAHHPLEIVKNRIVAIFNQVGFTLSEGPEIEDDWHNFTALNLPEHHPARDMQDTFFIQTDPDILLRTHTSSVQVRYMENNAPPFVPFLQGGCFGTRLFRRVPIVCSIRWKAY